MNDEQLVETPSAVPEVVAGTTFTSPPEENHPVRPEDVKPGELLKIAQAKPSGPVLPLPSGVENLLQKQKYEQIKARKHYEDLAAKHAKDIIFVAARMKMKPLALKAVRESAFALMEQRKDILPVAISMGIPDSVTQFSIWKFHLTVPKFDETLKEYVSVDKEGNSTAEIINQFVMEGLTPEFRGVVCFRDGSIAIGDPRHFFTQLMMTKMAADAQKAKHKQANRVH